MGAIMYSIYISIHAPTRGATQSCKGRNPFFQFQSTLPQGERHYTPGTTYPNNSNFNPRSHKGSDGHSLITSSPWYHFNPRSHKGSDEFPASSVLVPNISIHAPTRGATVLRERTFHYCLDFNPRSHKGSDCGQRLFRLVVVNFNPRSHKGSDVICPHFHTAFLQFQSTLPQGERRYISMPEVEMVLFQSTLPQGERPTTTILS